jgi:hypothetical protein
MPARASRCFIGFSPYQSKALAGIATLAHLARIYQAKSLISFLRMRCLYKLLHSLALLAIPATGFAQSIPLAAEAATGPVETAPRRTLLKLGLNVARTIRWAGYDGLSARLPVAVGVEYALNPKFTLYGQLDTDFRLATRNEYGDQHFFIPSGALGVGARYYYNQQSRAQHHRAAGPFIGNYVALELHTAMHQRAGEANSYEPSLNAVWGMQRRLGHHFLFDFNAGLGVGPKLNSYYNNYSNRISVNGQLNLNFYFVH